MPELDPGSEPIAPSATYRLQLSRNFTFADAKPLLAYLVRLGVSHLYLSPVFTARPGSTHGYDVVDPTTINVELGGEDGLRELAASCKDAGLGIILDIVPNHMAVSDGHNRYWNDILAHGRNSQFARLFDIDFDTVEPGISGKVVVPILGAPYGELLADGKISVIHEGAPAQAWIAYESARLPTEPCSLQTYLEETRHSDAGAGAISLAKLLNAQNYYLCWWRAAGDIINWRRFFDINELAGVRVEESEVFDLVHQKVLELFADGLIDGVRVDHIDGLADPDAYSKRLRQTLTAAANRGSEIVPKRIPYILAEKILADKEEVDRNWDIDGTTGYDFMDQVSAVLHDPAGEPILTSLWNEVAGATDDFDEHETLARQEIVRRAFSGQFAACARAFAAAARTDARTRDLTVEGFRRAVMAVIARLRIYRSYATGRKETPPLSPDFAQAVLAARSAHPWDAAAFDFLLSLLQGEASACGSPAAIEAVRRLNHLTAPVAAKAVEDTAFYRYGRLLSRNDVGFNPSRLALDPALFIESGLRRVRNWPISMLATATHDHKRGEDVRARLAVLSELPELWRAEATSWLGKTAAGRPPLVTPRDAYILFQTLAGAWPHDLEPNDRDGLRKFAERLQDWQLKALREAKLETSWSAPSPEFEDENRNWITALLDPAKSPSFFDSLHKFVRRIAPAGAINGLVQTALKCTWPGVPDIYNGSELWDFSLVDPDNRRPVDYRKREALLHAETPDWPSGAIKLRLLQQLLTLRRRLPRLFTHGSLAAIDSRGVKRDHILAFRRQAPDAVATVVVMLRVGRLLLGLGELPDADWWEDTEVLIGGNWCPAASLFERYPVYARAMDLTSGEAWALT